MLLLQFSINLQDFIYPLAVILSIVLLLVKKQLEVYFDQKKIDKLTYLTLIETIDVVRTLILNHGSSGTFSPRQLRLFLEQVEDQLRALMETAPHVDRPDDSSRHPSPSDLAT